MKKQSLKILISLLIFAYGVSLSYAYTLSESEFEARIKEEIILQTKNQLGDIGDGEIEVKILNMPKGTLQTKNEAQIKVETNRNGFLSRDVKRVNIYDGQNFLKSFPVGTHTLVYKNVLCAINPITREQNINVSNSKVKRAEIGQYIGQTIDSEPKNPLVATRNIQKDSPILKNYVKSTPDVLKDSVINLIFESGANLKVSVDAKALKEGSIGDRIPVKSIKYNKVYNAVVSDKNQATIKI